MSKLDEAKDILSAIGMPKEQTNDRSAYVLLSLANIKNSDAWADAKTTSLRIVDIMNFMAENYGKIYKPNTRETIRKSTIHQFVEGAVIEKNIDERDRPTNSPNYRYSLTDEMLCLIKTYGTNKWQEELSKFIQEKGRLVEKYSQLRDSVRIDVKVNNQNLSFSPGAHNNLQKLIVESFIQNFAKNAEVLYVGDTEDKDLVRDIDKLSSLGVIITEHDKLPDIILYSEEKNWLYFIEAVTSVGPISVKRMGEIEKMTESSNCGKIYVTAFPDRTIYKKFIDQLAWDTEVWIADAPEHMIHLNGDKFIGPRN